MNIPTVENKLRHIEHVEDLLFNDPIGGVHNAVDTFQHMLVPSQDSPLVTNVKIDGSPSIVFGPIPSGESDAGEFFVGTKSALSTTGKRYTHKNLEMVDLENPPGVASKIHNIFHVLSELNVSMPHQGDLLFSPAEPVTHHVNKTHQAYVFTPNVITYAIGENSPYYGLASTAKVGIVVHTCYRGDTFESMFATYDPVPIESTPSIIVVNNRVELADAFNIDYRLMNNVSLLMDLATGHWSSTSPQFVEDITANAELRQLIKRHVNVMIRQNVEIDGTHLLRFREYLRGWYEVETSKLKMDSSRRRINKRKTDDLAFIDGNINNMTQMLNSYKSLVDAKLLFLNNMNPVQGIDSYFNEGGYYRRTSGEGLVVANTTTNEIVKLVDRYDFSRINFAKVRDLK